MPELAEVHHLALTVTDVDRSVPWYERVLQLHELKRREDAETGIRKVFLRAGVDGLVLVLVQHPDTERPRFDERRTGLDHVAFRADSTAALRAWESRLEDYGVPYTPATGSQTLPGAQVVVFRDPDGIQLEVWCDEE